MQINPVLDYIWLCKHSVSSGFSLHFIFCEHKKAIVLISMCLVFRHTSGIPDGFEINATYAALQTWMELLSVTFRKKTESHILCSTVPWSAALFSLYPSFVLVTLISVRQSPWTCSPPCHRCCVSLHDFIINGCQCWAQERGAERTTRSQLYHLGATFDSI